MISLLLLLPMLIGVTIEEEGIQQLLKEVRSWPRRQGIPQLIQHLEGKHVSFKQRIVAMCCYCEHGWQDLPPSYCGIDECPLSRLHPYRNIPPKGMFGKGSKYYRPQDTDPDQEIPTDPKKKGLQQVSEGDRA